MIQLSCVVLAVSPKGATAHGWPVELVLVAQQFPRNPLPARLKLLCLIRCMSANLRLAWVVTSMAPSRSLRACVVDGSLIFSSHAAMVLRGSGKASRRSLGPSGFPKA